MSRELTPRHEVAQVGPGRKFSPTRLRLTLKHAGKTPVFVLICKRAGIGTSTLRRWLKLSAINHPAFTVRNEDGDLVRFHEAFADAIEDSLGHVENSGMELATGTYRKVLTHHGHVQYQFDHDLLSLGFKGEEAYKIDKETGQPIPEIVEEIDPDMVRFILKSRLPHIYNPPQVHDVRHSGGVLVVGAKLSSDEFTQKFVNKRPEDITDVEFHEVEDEDPTAAEPEGNPYD